MAACALHVLYKIPGTTDNALELLFTNFCVAGEFSLDDSKRLCILILEKALEQLPEGQGTVLGIFDLRGFKQKNGDLGFAGFLVSGPSVSWSCVVVFLLFLRRDICLPILYEKIFAIHST